MAFHPHQGAGCSRSHTVLACTCLSDDTVLAHLLGQQDLPQSIIDLVRPRMVEVFALEIDLRPVLLTETACVVKGARSPDIVT